MTFSDIYPYDCSPSVENLCMLVNSSLENSAKRRWIRLGEMVCILMSKAQSCVVFVETTFVRVDCTFYFTVVSSFAICHTSCDKYPPFRLIKVKCPTFLSVKKCQVCQEKGDSLCLGSMSRKWLVSRINVKKIMLRTDAVFIA